MIGYWLQSAHEIVQAPLILAVVGLLVVMFRDITREVRG